MEAWRRLVLAALARRGRQGPCSVFSGVHLAPDKLARNGHAAPRRVANILRLLLNEPALRDGPISFVCHSLGGLVIKADFRSAKEQRSDPVIADFFDRSRQVIFIATPHTGSGKATLMERAGFLVWGSDSAKDLVANKPELRDLNVGYRGLAEERREQLHHLVYYEMVDTLFETYWWLLTSADPGLPNCKPTPICEDHVTICKPRSL